MKNYWLNTIHEEETRDLYPVDPDHGIEALAQSYFVSGASTRRTGDQLAAALYALADKVLKYARPKWLNNANIDDFRQELLVTCFEKGHFFNPKEHKASDFFTTVMLGAMQVWHRRFRHTGC